MRKKTQKRKVVKTKTLGGVKSPFTPDISELSNPLPIKKAKLRFVLLHIVGILAANGIIEEGYTNDLMEIINDL